MKDETKAWLCYSMENLKSAKILLESTPFNLTRMPPLLHF